MSTFTCIDCKQEKPVLAMTTGYGEYADGKVCFDCCAVRDRKQMVESGRATLYLTKDAEGDHVGNWPGTLKFDCSVKKGRHNIAGSRYDVWFTCDGREWHGVQYGENTQVCHCKAVGPETFEMEFEYTDTYGGEANYCWVERTTVRLPVGISDTAIQRRAKAWAGLTGVPGRLSRYGDASDFRPYGMCTVLFTQTVY